MKRILIFLSLALTFTMMSCTQSVVGTWIEPSTSLLSEEQGFTLYKDGTASSINLGYTEFKNWEKEGDLLILKGYNAGSVKQDFSDTMKIEKVTKTELVLSQNNYSLTYKRK